MDKVMSRKVHTSVENILANRNTRRAGKNTRVANSWPTHRYVLNRERAHISQRLSMASNDRSTESSQQVDQEHGEGQQSKAY